MKRAIRHLMAALALVLVAAVLLAGGLLQRQIASGERELAALNLTRAADVFDQVENRLRFVDDVDWLLRDTKDEVEARRAAVRYWRGDYATLVSTYPDVGQPDIRSNVALQLTLGTAYVRSGEDAADGDRQLLLGELDRAISIYLQVLQNTEGHPEAAFNYEYLVRLRDELAAGEPPPPRRPPRPFGREGYDEDMDMENDGETKVYVPTDRFMERQGTDDPTLGTDAPIRRRG